MLAGKPKAPRMLSGRTSAVSDVSLRRCLGIRKPSGFSSECDGRRIPTPPEERINVSPRILRHMLPRKVANEKGVHYAVAPCGYRSDRYIGCYAHPDAQSLADTIDELD
jgi:hypothetical protein